MDFSTAFSFLTKLKKNNNREWFEKNKGSFLQIKESFEGFIGELLHDLVEFDPSLATQDPKKLVFRIYRDVRFSKDKRPYKTYLSAGISEEGRGTGKPGYYLQLEPGGKSFVCLGLYSPGPEVLAKIRQEIDYNGANLQEFFDSRNFKREFSSFWTGDSLKTAPKGYAKEHPYIEWLKLKSFVLMHPLTDEDVMNPKFRKRLVQVIKVGKPLNDFLKQAMD
jgi:uncharacterized protein (TIGR02453 family)